LARTVEEPQSLIGSRWLVLPSGGADPTLFYGVVAIAAFFGVSTLALGTRGRTWRISGLGVWGILSSTFRDSIRTKWVITFAAVFFFLAADLPAKALVDLNYFPADAGPIVFGALLSASLPLIPLLALPIGAVSIVDDRESGTMQYLLSNPITKFDFFLGRMAGLLLATTAVILVSFGSAAIIFYGSDAVEFRGVLTFALTATLLNAVMLALALLISEVSNGRATAIGVAIFVWFLLTALSDLDTLVYAVYWNVGVVAALSLILLDPIETSRIAAVLAGHLDPTRQLGRNGTLAQHFLGGNLLSILVVSVLVWFAFLTILGFLVFRRQDAT
jgi:ABC-2 type transport system permease protein/Cu-processing system permease protein